MFVRKCIDLECVRGHNLIHSFIFPLIWVVGMESGPHGCVVNILFPGPASQSLLGHFHGNGWGVGASLSPLTISIFFFSQKTPPCLVKLPSRFAHSITLLCWDGPLDPKENHQIPVQGSGLEHAFRNGTSCGQGDSVQAGYSCSPWTVTWLSAASLWTVVEMVVPVLCWAGFRSVTNHQWLTSHWV